jgi:hypothetical protein
LIGPYTALQLFETAAFAVLAIYGVLAHHPSFAAVGIGFLTGKAIMNILPRRYSVLSRSLVGYGVGLGLIGGVTILLVRYFVH